mgnify:CR=1 FL=1
MSKILHVLSAYLGLTQVDLKRIIATAPRRYKVYPIEKKNGGFREIAQPSRETKAMQRVLVDHFLQNLPIHVAATAYKDDASVAKNAFAHAGGTPILKMDFREFFPSIHGGDWANYCRMNGIFEEEDIAVSQNILFRRAKGEKTLKLSIGAPSSPLISNALLFAFDQIIQREADKRNIRYTRYADDITFSGQRIGMLKDMEKAVAEAVRQTKSPRLTINEEKTTYVTTAHRRFVTGVVLSNQGSISLGHQRKRTISARVHHAMLGRLDPRELAELAGTLAFVKVVEPDFLTRLVQKYGVETIEKIKKAPRVKRRSRFLQE